MKLTKIVIDCFLLIFLLSCCTFNISGTRLIPEHEGVDPKIVPYVNEYMDLAKIMGIKFKNKVSIGFKDINRGVIIGECVYGINFREINIDRNYWDHATPISKNTLIFHELAHCYCGRIHDYGLGKEYENEWEGRLEDGCKTSIMSPKILPDDCMVSHYKYYVVEAFDRCQPY